MEVSNIEISDTNAEKLGEQLFKAEARRAFFERYRQSAHVQELRLQALLQLKFATSEKRQLAVSERMNRKRPKSASVTMRCF